MTSQQRILSNQAQTLVSNLNLMHNLLIDILQLNQKLDFFVIQPYKVDKLIEKLNHLHTLLTAVKEFKPNYLIDNISQLIEEHAVSRIIGNGIRWFIKVEKKLLPMKLFFQDLDANVIEQIEKIPQFIKLTSYIEVNRRHPFWKDPYNCLPHPPAEFDATEIQYYNDPIRFA